MGRRGCCGGGTDEYDLSGVERSFFCLFFGVWDGVLSGIWVSFVWAWGILVMMILMSCTVLYCNVPCCWRGADEENK